MSTEIIKSTGDAEEQKACFNCKKFIDLSKIRIHESTCRRNTVKCGKCNEIIPRCIQEQHDFEFHEIIQCEYCQDFDCERFMMKEHHDYCFMKPVQCKYCELMISQNGDSFDQHLAYCGSKTRECEVCGTSLQQRELKAHMDSGICEIVLEDKIEAQKKKAAQDLEKFQQHTQARIANQANAATGKVLQKQPASSSQQSSNSNNTKAGQKRPASKAIPIEEEGDGDTPTRKIMDENKTKISKMLNMDIKTEQKKEQENRKREIKQKEKKVQKKFFM